MSPRVTKLTMAKKRVKLPVKHSTKKMKQKLKIMKKKWTRKIKNIKKLKKTIKKKKKETTTKQTNKQKKQIETAIEYFLNKKHPFIHLVKNVKKVSTFLNKME